MKKTNEKALTSEAIKELVSALESRNIKPAVINETTIVAKAGSCYWTVEEEGDAIIVQCDYYPIKTFYTKNSLDIANLIASSKEHHLPLNYSLYRLYVTLNDSLIFTYVDVTGVDELSFNINDKPFILNVYYFNNRIEYILHSSVTGADVEINSTDFTVDTIIEIYEFAKQH